jgi:hypothetical protein
MWSKYGVEGEVHQYQLIMRRQHSAFWTYDVHFSIRFLLMLSLRSTCAPLSISRGNSHKPTSLQQPLFAYRNRREL